VPQKAQAKDKRKVVSLDDYRKEKQVVIPTIEIRLLPSGGIGYSASGLQQGDTFRALLGCYALTGELLQKLRDDLKCGTNDRSTE